MTSFPILLRLEGRTCVGQAGMAPPGIFIPGRTRRVSSGGSHQFRRISTDGRSPALAARLRRELEKQFGPEWEPFVEHIGKLRQQFLSAGKPLENKREQLAELAGQKAFLSFRRQLVRATRRGT
jgi:hypothetical protein